eukprot:IDg6631t1
MASKRGGLSGHHQGRRFFRSTGDKPSTNEPLTVSSEFADINQRAHEQVFHERAEETQQEISKDNPPPKRDAGGRLIPPKVPKLPTLRRPVT